LMCHPKREVRLKDMNVYLKSSWGEKKLRH
jgi:hypothetical protein